MKKNIFIIFFVGFYLSAFAQNSEKINFEDVGCLKYRFSTISQEDAQNKLLFDYQNNNSLIEIVVDGLEKQGLSVFSNISFEEILTLEEVYNRLGQFEEPMSEQETLVYPYVPEEIVAFKIKELLIYDKQGKLLQSFVEGLCPIRENLGYDGEVRKNELFWFYFPEYSPILKKQNENLYNFISEKKYEAKPDNEVFVNEQVYSRYHDHIFIYPEKSNSKEINKLDTILYSDIKYAEIKYRILDTANAENLPLFMPQNYDDNIGYNTLMEVIYKSVNKYGLSAYNANLSFSKTGEPFMSILTNNEFQEILGQRVDTLISIDLDGQLETLTVLNPVQLQEVREYIIQELWLYGNNDELIDVRTLGIAPVRHYYVDGYEGDVRKKIVCWVYFPEFQHIARRHNASKLDCSPTKTFDDIFFKQEYKSDKYWHNIHETYKSDTIIFDTLRNFVNLKELNYCQVAIKFDEKQTVQKKKKQKKAKYTKTVYTKIEKSEKNAPIFNLEYPAYGYTSVIDHILDNVYKQGLTAYHDDEMTTVMKEEELNVKMGEKIESIIGYNPETGDEEVVKIQVPISSKEATSYLTKEIWHYRGKKVVKKEIVAICPVREHYRDNDVEQKNPLYTKTFWVSYKDLETYFKDNHITKTQPVADQTIYDFFESRNYEFEIIEKP